MPSRRVTVPPSVLVQAVGDEAVLLDLTSERYFGLDEVGAYFWEVITASAGTDEAFQRLAEAYDVAPDVLAADLERFVDDLLANGLLVEVDA
jgi:hypothetical protein